MLKTMSVGLLAALVLPALPVKVGAQDKPGGSAGCGVEGLDPCKDGCQTRFLPKGTVPNRDWYPLGDNYAPAPKGYKRAPEGKCTRCGNIFEPPCAGNTGEPLCFPGMYSRVGLIVSKDNLCIPEREQEGCGTHGKPVCPPNVVDSLGTLALLQSPAESNPWRIMPTLYEREGCIFSDHNPQLRFVKAPKEWLPTGHECAELCVHCGHAGEPACPVEPSCSRRMSLEDPMQAMEGPVYKAEDGTCKGMLCGGDTYTGPLHKCPDGELNKRLGPGVDVAGDGCAEPFAVDSYGMCSKTKPFTNANSPKLHALETQCVEPGQRILTDELDKLLLKNQVSPGVDIGGCEACGRDKQIPCQGTDFGGCFVNEGVILDTASGLCKTAQCGGTGDPSTSTAPYGSPQCAAEPVPTYDAAIDPINKHTSCLFFHNLQKGAAKGPKGHSGADSCTKCGWPGRRCEKECIYTVQWNAVGLPYQNVGTYRLRSDLRSKEHCADLPIIETYPGNCADPYPEGSIGSAYAGPGGGPPVQGVGQPITLGKDGKPIASDAGKPLNQGVGTPVHIGKDGKVDVTYGTADNRDECQHSLEDIDVVWTTECPGGGRPVPKYGQCGGEDWDGPTCCFGYAICVQKNEYFHQCEDANVPSGIVPWHMPCDPDNAETVCEAGSDCTRRGDSGFCEPRPEMVVVAPSSACGAGAGAGAAVGGTFLGIGLLGCLFACCFACHKRRRSGLGMSSLPSMPKVGERVWRARDYVATSTVGGKGGKGGVEFDPTDPGESDTHALAMEDSAADEFIDMRVPVERAPMLSSAARSGTLDGGATLGSGAVGDSSGGFHGGFGGGGGSGIGRGGIGRLNRSGISRNGRSQQLGHSGSLK